MNRAVRRIAEFLGALLVAPVLLLASGLALFAADLAHFLKRGSVPTPNRAPDTSAVSVVIPNWNGCDLLEKYLPSVIEAVDGNPANEIIVVDNGSEDGSADFVRRRFPQVTLLALPENLGFGGGSNAGFRAAKNDIVVLLNSDMRVDPNFLTPLLDAFTRDDIFAVACQIFLSDPAKRREETGLTEGWWQDGKLRVSHRDDPAVDRAFPCFYAGGGSSAFDRAKFLELGGFDELLAPFYLEDTDLGFLAWKRGWKVMYAPAGVVYHEHRGTIGRKFSPAFIDGILKKNYLLFVWKNIHDARMLASAMFAAWAGALASAATGAQPLRTDLAGIWRAFRQIPAAVRSRMRARALSLVPDREAFARSRAGHFRDRYMPVSAPASAAPVSAEDEKLRVLFVSPYPILPPAHGGAVFMLETVRELSKLAELHALVLLDEPSQAEANRGLSAYCTSLQIAVRPNNPGRRSIAPHAVDEFASRDVQWLIDRIVYLHRIDIVQIEYTAMGQYLEDYRHIGAALFEHDIFFQSIARVSAHLEDPMAKWKARFEYLRALRWELNLLRRCDRVQVCTPENRDYLLQFDPRLAPRVEAGLRACIDTAAYVFPGGPREADSLLFIGSSRHEPNRAAIAWFLAKAFPQIAAQCPQVTLRLAGFDEQSGLAHPNARLLGYVEDVKPLLARCAVFVCPILSGSGVRVKLLEAFAAGIPVVSTRIGAEGLARVDAEFCALADSPEDFASRVVQLLRAPDAGRLMAERAREEVIRNWDSAAVTRRLESSYRDLLETKRRALQSARNALE